MVKYGVTIRISWGISWGFVWDLHVFFSMISDEASIQSSRKTQHGFFCNLYYITVN